MEFGSILLAAFGIGLLIFLHEAGHFLAARLAGVRVEVFSLGFGTRVAGFQWRGTDFRLSPARTRATGVIQRASRCGRRPSASARCSGRAAW
jgi:hypothetical protein